MALESILALDATTTGVLSIILLTSIFILRYDRKKRPPGPFAFPLVGNLPQVARAVKETSITGKKPFLASKKLAEAYGGMVSLWMGARPVVVVTGYERVKEGLLDKGNVLINRPHDMFFFTDLLQNRGVFAANGSTWKETRRFTLMGMRDLGVGKKSLEEIIMAKFSVVVKEICEHKGKPFNPAKLFLHSVANSIGTVIFGHRFEYDNEDFVYLMGLLNYLFVSGGINMPENYFPWLKYVLPGREAPRKLIENNQRINEYVKSRVAEHELTYDSQNIRDFIDLYIQIKRDGSTMHSLTDTDVHRSMVDLYLGGSETTTASILWMMHYMIAYPEVQAKCHAEINKVVGSGRRVTTADRKSLPYVVVTMQESQRLRVTIPVAPPHVATQDTSIGGLPIPANTAVFYHLLSVNTDPNHWGPDPQGFRPERWLSETGTLLHKAAYFPFSAGIQGELSYVRDGVINNYALSFNLPIQAHIDDIYFTWQNLRPSLPGTDVSPQMYYKMGFTVSHPRALHPPEASIASEGIVPTEITPFRIRLRCSGLASVEVNIRIQMNISIFSASNHTTLNIRRRKTCREDFGGDHNHRKINLQDQNVSYTFPEDSSDTGGYGTSTNIFYIAVGCACGLILFIALVVALYYIRLQKSSRAPERMRYTIPKETSSTAGLHGGAAFLRADTPSNSVISSRRPFSPIAEMPPQTVRGALAEIAMDRPKITLSDVLLEGTFGRIYTGIIVGDEESDIQGEQPVIIKTVTDQARPDQIEKMLAESVLMKGMFHINIYPIIGASTDDEKHPLLVFPHTDLGNFKKFLLKCRVSDITHPTFSTQQLVYMALQILRGLQFLHRKRIVHRDVAVRNCVLDNNLVIKITDTALSRDLFPNDYHCLGDNENRPVKWLAIEAILERRFTPSSDVWAFGVTLWELLTMAQQPYADIDPFEMAAYIREGYRISQPMNCPDELFALMACCWALNPDERPKVSQLIICLQDFYTALGRYI